MMKKITSLILVSSLFSFHSVFAQENKGELISDRPGVTDSPLTSRPGKYRLETQAFGFTYDQGRESHVFANTSLIGGILKDTEIQLGFGGFINEPEARDPQSGAADTFLRMKYSLSGNNGEDTGVAILPYVVLPTGKTGFGSDKVSMGINVPFSFSLNEKVSLGLMPMWFHEPNQDQSGLHHDFQLATIVGFKVLEKLDIFVQAMNKASTETGPGWQALYGGGAAYIVRSDFQIDLEVNSGITERDENLLVTTGFTYILN